MKSQIETVLEQGVISPVTAPTEWCAGIAPVLKPNGKVRISVDLTKFNKAVQWEVHPMSSVDESQIIIFLYYNYYILQTRCQ